MLGVDLRSDFAVDVEFKMQLEKKTLLLASMNKHCLLMTPPLVMTDEEFGKVCDDLRDVLTSFATKVESMISKPRSWAVGGDNGQ